MQAVALHSQPFGPAMTCDRDELERVRNISSVKALLDDIKACEPSRGELIQVIGDACGGVLNAASCARLADAVLALLRR